MYSQQSPGTQMVHSGSPLAFLMAGLAGKGNVCEIHVEMMSSINVHLGVSRQDLELAVGHHEGSSKTRRGCLSVIYSQVNIFIGQCTEA